MGIFTGYRMIQTQQHLKTANSKIESVEGRGKFLAFQAFTRAV
jgi:hypothetical protein